MPSEITIVAVENENQKKQFLDFPYELYKDDPNWRAPLRMERRDQLNPAKNPSLKKLDVQLFLALKGGNVVGRIAAILNPAHLKQYKDNTGHFGFLDVENEPHIMNLLLKAAEDWLKAKGMQRIVGPLNFSVNEDLGLPIEGFDTPPMLMMPFGRPDYQETIESLGYEKEIDLQAYITNVPDSYPHPKMVQTMCDVVDKDPRVTTRQMDKKNFVREVQAAMEVFNNAWSDNWGFIPFSDEQINHIANELKPIIVDEFFWVCDVDGVPAAFALMVPNINEAAYGLNGRLLPFGWLKLLYRLKFKGVKTGRILLMGVNKEFQKTRLGLGMAAKLSANIFDRARKRGYQDVEMSWILETNKSMIRIIKMGGGKLYKTYRMYRKDLN